MVQLKEVSISFDITVISQVILRFLRFILANERMHGDVQLGILKYSRIYIFILLPMCYVLSHLFFRGK